MNMETILKRKINFYFLRIISYIIVLSLASTITVDARAENATPTPRLIIDPGIITETTPSPSANVQTDGIAIPGWASIRIPCGKKIIPLTLNNPDENSVYLCFKLYLEDDGVTIFETGLIPPGMHCTEVTLTEPLEAGEYRCIMFVQPYTMTDNPEPLHNAEMQTLLIVE